MKKRLPILFFLIFSLNFLQSQDKKPPSFEEVLSLKSVSSPEISPDGNHILFQTNAVDWEKNRYDTEIWLSKNSKSPFQLTNNLDGSSTNPKWSPDGEWIAFLSKREEKTQIQVINFHGGEAFQVTNSKQNIGSFEWSPDGTQIAYIETADDSKKDKEKEDKYGGFEIEDKEFSFDQLWVIPFAQKNLNHYPLPAEKKDSILNKLSEAILLIDSAEFTITDFLWSPDGKYIAFNHQPDPILISFMKSDISVLDLNTKEHQILVANQYADGLLDWSPDSKSILYTSDLDNNDSNFYLNSRYFRINMDGSNNIELGKSFDENLNNLKWTSSGIYGIAWQKTKRELFNLDPINGNVLPINCGFERIYDFSISKNGKSIAFTASNDDDLVEMYKNEWPLKSNQKITQTSDQIKNWLTAKSEIISWKSEDGALIEGVLYKPQNYDPAFKYPLMVVIHGGPTGTSIPNPVPSYVYPILQWLNKGALVLSPNYRGSAGYGEKFRSLNVENLGVGDAWDVMSGIKYLEDKGIVDGNSLASMGWSQGGYISAFLATNTDKFKAISVGAGISNWVTYYVSTDIHPFTRQYLKATPWSNMEIYKKTSPMTNINNAKTPTLIQHGEFDRRVPTSNAYELYQGLQDVGVDTELIIYKGFGHGITKPRERLAATWHNWKWFGKYLWGEEIEIPMKNE